MVEDTLYTFVRSDRMRELGDFIEGLFEWGADDPHDQAEEIKKFLLSLTGLDAYRERQTP